MRDGHRRTLALALAEVEAGPWAEASLALLDAAWAACGAQLVGVTGPPGVGKSTLVSAIAAAARRTGRTVGILAIDPSSGRSGGALLGDRTRIESDPEDVGIFIRSVAARDHLGGTAATGAALTTLLGAVFDLVLVETVGIGQSETEIVDLVDTVVLAVQPGSGDLLQFMKAGILEIPDIAVVTKADMGASAERAAADLAAALGSLGAGSTAQVLLVSAPQGRGLPELMAAIDGRAGVRDGRTGAAGASEARARRWLQAALRAEVGRRGLAALQAAHGEMLADTSSSPFRRAARALAALQAAPSWTPANQGGGRG